MKKILLILFLFCSSLAFGQSNAGENITAFNLWLKNVIYSLDGDSLIAPFSDSTYRFMNVRTAVDSFDAVNLRQLIDSMGGISVDIGMKLDTALKSEDALFANASNDSISSQLAIKTYIDAASTAFNIAFFFNNTASDVGGIYYDMTNLGLGGVESTLTTGSLTQGTSGNAAFNFLTDITGGEGILSIPAGIFEYHGHVEKTSGSSDATVYAEIYKRASGGTETLITTTETSGVITSKTDVTLHASTIIDVDLLTTDRILIKLLVDVASGGSGATMAFYQEGTTVSRLRLPTTTEILNQIFVRQDGTKELTADWDAGAFTITAEQFNADIAVQFTPQSTVSYSEGLVYYDSDDKTLVVYNDEADIALNVGSEMWKKVRNNTGGTILDGTPVYMTGAIGQLPTIDSTDADFPQMSKLIGLTTHDIENNSNGYITVFGIVRGLDTDGSPYGESWSDGDSIYISQTKGWLTNVRPSDAYVVCVGHVDYAHTSQGRLQIHPCFDWAYDFRIVNDINIGGKAVIGDSLRVVGKSLFKDEVIINSSLGIGTEPERLLHLSNANPQIGFTESDAPTNDKNWAFSVNARTFSLLTRNDNWSAISTVWTILRGGNMVTGGSIGIGTEPVRLLHLSNVNPQIGFTESDAPTNDKNWAFSVQDGTFSLLTRNDNWSTKSTVWTILRDGNMGLGFTAPLSKLSINGGLHVGGESDAGDNNLLVDGLILNSTLTNTYFPVYNDGLINSVITQSGGNIDIDGDLEVENFTVNIVNADSVHANWFGGSDTKIGESGFKLTVDMDSVLLTTEQPIKGGSFAIVTSNIIYDADYSTNTTTGNLSTRITNDSIDLRSDYGKLSTRIIADSANLKVNYSTTASLNISDWNDAHTHITEDGSSHLWVGQDLRTSSSPVFSGETIITDVTALTIKSSTTGSKGNLIRWQNSVGAARFFLGAETTNEDFYIDNLAGNTLFYNGDLTMQLTTSNDVVIPNGDLSVVDDAYAAGWNASTNVPTKNAVYDKIESLTSGADYQGTVDGSDGTPDAGGGALIDGIGTDGDWYRVTTAGTYDYGDPNGNEIETEVGDDLYYNGATWELVPGQGYTLQLMTPTVLGGAKVGISLATGQEPDTDKLNIKEGDKGDISVTGDGATWTIDADVVTYSKIQNVSADERILGRVSGAGGDIEELTQAQVITFLGGSALLLNTNNTLNTVLTNGASSALAMTVGDLVANNGNFISDIVPITFTSATSGSKSNHIRWENSSNVFRGAIGFETTNEDFYIDAATGDILHYVSSGLAHTIYASGDHNFEDGDMVTTGSLTATSLIKSGGASSQFLLANGDVTTISDFGKTLVDDADAATAQATIGLPTWAGSSNITNLGTIISGTWEGADIEDEFITKTGTWIGDFEGTPITQQYGGTGLTSISTLLNSNTTASDISDFDTEVSNNSSVVDNTAKVISDVAYNSTTWNNNLDAASKNAIRDLIEAMIVDGEFDDLLVNDELTVGNFIITTPETLAATTSFETPIITKSLVMVTNTVDNYSVHLPSAVAGMSITIVNNSSFTLRVYSYLEDVLQDNSGSDYFSISGNKSTTIFAASSSLWVNPEQAW